MKVDRLWTNARIATLDPARPGLGVVESGAIAARDGRIVWVGPRAEQPALEAAERIDLEGRWITPGLIDCHTHLVYGGNRAHEFELRLAGATYEEIARAGGGILSTVKATRTASEDELVAQALPRLDALIAEGVTTIEIKSGYGLDMETEARQLRAARRLAGNGPYPSPPRSSARTPCRRKPTATRTATSPACARRCCPPSPRRSSPTRSTPSWRASPSAAAQTARVFEVAQAPRACP